MNAVDSDPGSNLPQVSLQGWSPILCNCPLRTPPGTGEAHGPAFGVALPSKASLGGHHLLVWAFLASSSTNGGMVDA